MAKPSGLLDVMIGSMIARTPLTPILDMAEEWMREKTLKVLQSHAKTRFELHDTKIRVHLLNLLGSGGHLDILEGIQSELDKNVCSL